MIASRMASLCSALLLSLLPLGAAAQAPTLEGRVAFGPGNTPVAGTAIGVEYGAKIRQAAAETDAAGRFRLELATLFPGYVARLPDVTLSFEKPDHEPVVRVLPCAPAGSVNCGDLLVRMPRLAGGTGLSNDERALLDPLRRPGGTTIFLMPYLIGGGADAGQVDLDALAWSLHRVINTGLQESAFNSDDPLLQPPPEIGITTITDLAVKRSDTERLRQIGEFVEALALVGGFGQPAGSAQPDAVRLSSHYFVVPQLPRFRTGALFIDDQVPTARLNSPDLYEQLSDNWALHTLLAISIRQIQAASAGRDADALRQVHGRLVAKRSEYGADEQAKVRPLTRLIAIVDGELSKLEGG